MHSLDPSRLEDRLFISSHRQISDGMMPELTELAAIRRRLQITQSELASRAGVSQSLISKVESGEVVPAYDRAKKVFDALEELELEAGELGPGRASGRRKRLEEVAACTGVIGVVDTTFSSVDSASVALREIRRLAPRAEVKRYTVPGIRDTPLACKLLIEREGCEAVVATGMVSRKGSEKRVEDQAAMGIVLVQLLTGRHVICAFFDEGESKDPRRLRRIVAERTKKHVLNALRLMVGPGALSEYAGLGLRQGSRDVGPLRA